MHRSPSPPRFKVNRIAAPCSGCPSTRLSAQILPPYASTSILVMCSPSPKLLRVDEFSMKRSKRVGFIASGIPGPLSVTDTSSIPSFRTRALIAISTPRPPNRMLFEIMLWKTTSSFSSASTVLPSFDRRIR